MKTFTIKWTATLVLITYFITPTKSNLNKCDDGCYLDTDTYAGNNNLDSNNNNDHGNRNKENRDIINLEVVPSKPKRVDYTPFLNNNTEFLNGPAHRSQGTNLASTDEPIVLIYSVTVIFAIIILY